jgi:pimeloyl-ACP methyl ester carboxylesterase
MSGAVASTQHAVSFTTPDGYTLHVDQYGEGGRGVVLVHGGRFTKEGWKKQAEALAKRGFNVLAIDFRGYGQTVPGTETTDERHYPDVLSAVRYLRGLGVKSVAVVGASMGGDAAGDAVAESKPGEIDKLVLLASEGGDTPKRLTVDKLFILCRGDRNSEGLRLPRIMAAYEAAPEPKKLKILEGDAHAQFIFETDQGPQLMSELLDFLSAPGGSAETRPVQGP